MKRPMKARDYPKNLKFEDGGPVPYPTPDPRNDYRKARRDLRGTPPVTVMEDLIGRFSPSKAESNAVRDAIRERAFQTIDESGYEKKDK